MAEESEPQVFEASPSRSQISPFSRRKRFSRNRRGATMVLLAVLIPASLVIAAYCINVVYMELTRTELQIATDVATRASGRVLAITGNKQKATDKALDMLGLNIVAQQALPASAIDIEFGVSRREGEKERYQFSDGKNSNAVKILSNGSFRPPMLFPTLGVPIDFRPIKSAISTQTELDMALVLDRSGSMAFAADEASSSGIPAAAPPDWKFGDPVPPKARWIDTVAAVENFLHLMRTSSHDERVALITYSNNVKKDEKLTDDYAAIAKQMRDYSAKFKGGSTNIGGGILEGAKALSDKKRARPWASRVIIVMSDGRHNTGIDPIIATTQAAQQNIIVYTVTFSNEADLARMREVANLGSGAHFHAVNSSQLVQAFEDIAHSLPTLITF